MNGLARKKFFSKIMRDFHGNYRYIKNEQPRVESYDSGQRLTVTWRRGVKYADAMASNTEKPNNAGLIMPLQVGECLSREHLLNTYALAHAIMNRFRVYITPLKD